jgi:hypothetical protein
LNKEAAVLISHLRQLHDVLDERFDLKNFKQDKYDVNAILSLKNTRHDLILRVKKSGGESQKLAAELEERANKLNGALGLPAVKMTFPDACTIKHKNVLMKQW